MRRNRPEKRVVLPDPRYNNELVAHLINKIMLSGKKATAEQIVYGAMENLETRSKKPAVEALEQSIRNATPMIEVRPRRVGGATYQVPMEIREDRRLALALRWLIQEMTDRYRLFGRVGARHLEGFNTRPPDAPGVTDQAGRPIPRHLPRIVLVIDELADIMLSARQDVETSLARIAQMSRAVGIHTIIATQRPSVNIITGVIKANFPTRVAFQVASQVDARTILDAKGAESLLGRGDMLFRPPGSARIQRLQAPLVADEEIEAVAGFASAQGGMPADFSLLRLAGDDGRAVESGDGGDEAVDEALIRQAMEIVIRDRRASTSYLQRRLRIGYNRAATLMDCLEERGIVGPSLGAGPREILVDSPPP